MRKVLSCHQCCVMDAIFFTDPETLLHSKKKTKNQKKKKKQNETGTSLFGKRKFNFGGSIKITPESLTQDVFLFQNKINRTHLNVHNGVIVISKKYSRNRCWTLLPARTWANQRLRYLKKARARLIGFKWRDDYSLQYPKYAVSSTSIAWAWPS